MARIGKQRRHLRRIGYTVEQQQDPPPCGHLAESAAPPLQIRWYPPLVDEEIAQQTRNDIGHRYRTVMTQLPEIDGQPDVEQIAQPGSDPPQQHRLADPGQTAQRDDRR
nr:hypothetical protein [Nocardia cyriacigeorgica]